MSWRENTDLPRPILLKQLSGRWQERTQRPPVKLGGLKLMKFKTGQALHKDNFIWQEIDFSIVIIAVQNNLSKGSFAL